MYVDIYLHTINIPFSKLIVPGLFMKLILNRSQLVHTLSYIAIRQSDFIPNIGLVVRLSPTVFDRKY